MAVETVINTHGRVRSSLAIVRSLGRKGIRPVVGDSIYPAMSFFSRYCRSHFLYPSFKREPAFFLEHLSKVCDRIGARVLIPTYEETILLAHHKDKFPNLTIPVGNGETISNVNDKGWLVRFGEDLGIPVPVTHMPRDVGELKRLANKMEYPCVIKPAHGHGAGGVKYINSPEELRREYARAVERSGEGLLIQAYIGGTGYGVSVLYNHGDMRAHFIHRRLREYPLTGGPSTYRESVHNDGLLKITKKLMDELKWHGVAMVEYKIEERTQNPYLMEVNPRFWGSLPLALSSGVDFPYLLYQIATEGDCPRTTQYRENIRSRWLLGDLRGLLKMIQEKKKLSSEYLKGFLRMGKSEKTDELAWDDPLPALIEPLIPIKNYLSSGSLRFTPQEEM